MFILHRIVQKIGDFNPTRGIVKQKSSFAILDSMNF